MEVFNPVLDAVRGFQLVEGIQADREDRAFLRQQREREIELQEREDRDRRVKRALLGAAGAARDPETGRFDVERYNEIIQRDPVLKPAFDRAAESFSPGAQFAGFIPPPFDPGQSVLGVRMPDGSVDAVGDLGDDGELVTVPNDPDIGPGGIAMSLLAREFPELHQQVLDTVQTQRQERGINDFLRFTQGGGGGGRDAPQAPSAPRDPRRGLAGATEPVGTSGATGAADAAPRGDVGFGAIEVRDPQTGETLATEERGGAGGSGVPEAAIQQYDRLIAEAQARVEQLRTESPPNVGPPGSTPDARAAQQRESLRQAEQRVEALEAERAEAVRTGEPGPSVQSATRRAGAAARRGLDAAGTAADRFGPAATLRLGNEITGNLIERGRKAVDEFAAGFTGSGAGLAGASSTPTGGGTSAPRREAPPRRGLSDAELAFEPSPDQLVEPRVIGGDVAAAAERAAAAGVTPDDRAALGSRDSQRDFLRGPQEADDLGVSDRSGTASAPSREAPPRQGERAGTGDERTREPQPVGATEQETRRLRIGTNRARRRQPDGQEAVDYLLQLHREGRVPTEFLTDQLAKLSEGRKVKQVIQNDDKTIAIPIDENGQAITVFDLDSIERSFGRGGGGTEQQEADSLEETRRYNLLVDQVEDQTGEEFSQKAKGTLVAGFTALDNLGMIPESQADNPFVINTVLRILGSDVDQGLLDFGARFDSLDDARPEDVVKAFSAAQLGFQSVSEYEENISAPFTTFAQRATEAGVPVSASKAAEGAGATATFLMREHGMSREAALTLIQRTAAQEPDSLAAFAGQDGVTPRELAATLARRAGGTQ